MSTMEPDEGTKSDDQEADAPRWERAKAAEGADAPRWERTEAADLPPGYGMTASPGDDLEPDDPVDS